MTDQLVALDQATLEATVLEAFGEALEAELAPDDNFFNHGGDSLVAMMVLSDLQVRLDLELEPTAVMSYPTATELAAAILSGEATETTVAEPAPPIDPDERRGSPTSLVQQAVLAMTPFKSSRGFLSWVYQLNGLLDVEAMSAAVDDAVARHEVLRTRFVEGPEGPRQVVRPFVPQVLSVVDLTHMDKGPGISAAVAAAEETFLSLSPFVDPGLTATLYRIGPKTNVLAMFVAEALVDAESGSLVAACIAHEYARLADLPLPDAPLPSDASFIEHVRAHPVSPEAERAAEDHWRAAATEALPVGAWPTELADEVLNHSFTMKPGTWDKVVATAKALSVTPYVVVLSCFEIAFGRVTDADAFPLTSVVIKRGAPETAAMIGSFHSVIRHRADVTGLDRFPEVVARTSASLQEAVTHSVVPAPLAEARRRGQAAGGPLAPAIGFYMFKNKDGMDVAGTRQRRFRLSNSTEALRVNCAPKADGTFPFYLTSATAPRLLLERLGSTIEAVITAVIGDPDVRLDHIVTEEIV